MACRPNMPLGHVDAIVLKQGESGIHLRGDGFCGADGAISLFFWILMAGLLHRPGVVHPQAGWHAGAQGASLLEQPLQRIDVGSSRRRFGLEKPRIFMYMAIAVSVFGLIEMSATKRFAVKRTRGSSPPSSSKKEASPSLS